MWEYKALQNIFFIHCKGTGLFTVLLMFSVWLYAKLEKNSNVSFLLMVFVSIGAAVCISALASFLYIGKFSVGKHSVRIGSAEIYFKDVIGYETKMLSDKNSLILLLNTKDFGVIPIQMKDDMSLDKFHSIFKNQET